MKKRIKTALISVSDKRNLKPLLNILVKNKIKRRYYNFNHFEYDLDTLKNEYKRDLKLDKKTPVPFNYFPNNDPERKPTDLSLIHI